MKRKSGTIFLNVKYIENAPGGNAMEERGKTTRKSSFR
jgi:hypothetical protein